MPNRLINLALSWAGFNVEAPGILKDTRFGIVPTGFKTLGGQTIADLLDDEEVNHAIAAEPAAIEKKKTLFLQKEECSAEWAAQIAALEYQKDLSEMEGIGWADPAGGKWYPSQGERLTGVINAQKVSASFWAGDEPVFHLEVGGVQVPCPSPEIFKKWKRVRETWLSLSSPPGEDIKREREKKKIEKRKAVAQEEQQEKEEQLREELLKKVS